jgi:hypothetical protein
MKQTILLCAAAILLAGCGDNHSGTAGKGGGGNDSDTIKGMSLGGTDMHHGGEQGDLMLRSRGLLGPTFPGATNSSRTREEQTDNRRNAQRSR